MTVTREVRENGWCATLDLGKQVLHVEAAADEDALRALLPNLPHSPREPTSAAALLLKAKRFDDGLYAAVDLAAQHGAGGFAGKARLLRSLADALLAEPADAPHAALILAAGVLGGLAVPDAPALHAAVRALLEPFLGDELRSKPLGHYAWSPDLTAIFRQDRLLQTILEPATADALARALDRAAGGWSTYDACLRLAERLTNPLAVPGLRGDAEVRAFFPPSRSHEVVLFEKLYGDRPIPEGFDPMTEMIREVRSGGINLEPTKRSGWYDLQTWSLAPLLVPERMPESARLQCGQRYRRHLEDLFRGALALAREAHVKQAGGGYGGGSRGPRVPPIWVSPDLTVEPLPTLYARRATCYRFVQSLLEEEFGAATLKSLHRLTPAGPREASLAEELPAMERLFAGAAETACRELGMTPLPGTEGAGPAFADWREGARSDPDVSGDARMMVPVFYDVQRRQTKVWALLGWRATPVAVSYRVPPAVTRVAPQGPGEPARELDAPPVLFSGGHYHLAVPVLAEVYVNRLLDRDEFRRLCALHRTREAILANLR